MSSCIPSRKKGNSLRTSNKQSWPIKGKNPTPKIPELATEYVVLAFARQRHSIKAAAKLELLS